jgi:hypothetical protein
VIERVRQELEKSNLSIENVMAETLVLKLDEVERIDHIIAQTEARRVRILREMDRHRTALATCLREATQALGRKADHLPQQVGVGGLLYECA